MAGIQMHQVRSFVAGVVALVGVVVLAAFAAAAMDIHVPGLSMITDAFGVSPAGSEESYTE